ncbi:MAG TPA: hypothetical protein VH640_10025 [Bryobacteraceae bacterium]
MRFQLLCLGLVIASTVSLPAWSQDTGQQGPALNKVPAGVILVKGAWSSASDITTPVPEGGNVADNVFRDPYFGMTYPLPDGWTEKYKGPPPSDSGRYVLAQLSPRDTFQGSARGSILITAQDMFFAPGAASDASGLIDRMKDQLQADYQVETAPTQIKIADRFFTFFAYRSPVAQLHWYVLATQIRCHSLEIVMTSRDTKLLESLVRDMNKMRLSAEATGGTVPVCINDYARDENPVARVDPVFTEHRFNPVPVRIIIDKEGKVKHIHFLSAFSDQAKAISDALGQWRFKPYRMDGQPVEVETGILFGRGTGQ